jgi:hypothetical protein
LLVNIFLREVEIFFMLRELWLDVVPYVRVREPFPQHKILSLSKDDNDTPANQFAATTAREGNADSSTRFARSK